MCTGLVPLITLKFKCHCLLSPKPLPLPKLKLFSLPPKPLVPTTLSFLWLLQVPHVSGIIHSLVVLCDWLLSQLSPLLGHVRISFLPTWNVIHVCVDHIFSIPLSIHGHCLIPPFGDCERDPVFNALGWYPEVELRVHVASLLNCQKNGPDCHLLSTAALLSFLTSNAQILCILSSTHYLVVLVFFLFLVVTGVWTQSLTLARQAFYRLSYSTSPAVTFFLIIVILVGMKWL
jgi:hypothetical protein